MNIEQERTDFEAWCETRHLETGRDDEGDYISLETALSWDAYQAGRAALKAQNADAGLDVEAVLRLFLTGDGFIAECDIPHIVAALQSQDRTAWIKDLLHHARIGVQSQERKDALEAENMKLREALEMMVEMVEMNGFGRDYAMDVARAALNHARRIVEEGE